MKWIPMLLAVVAVLGAGCAALEQFAADNADPPGGRAGRKPPAQPPTHRPGADAAVGGAMKDLGMYLGIPLLAAAGGLVLGIKPVRKARKLARDLISSVQSGRTALAGHDDDALDRFDRTVEAAQGTKTSAAIKCLKEKAGLCSARKTPAD